MTGATRSANLPLRCRSMVTAPGFFPVSLAVGFTDTTGGLGTGGHARATEIKDSEKGAPA